MPDPISDLIVRIITETEDWAIVTIIGFYVAFRAYEKHKDGKVLSILETTVNSILTNIDRNISHMTSKIDIFISSVEK